MAINPNIPLGVTPVRSSNALSEIAGAFRQKQLDEAAQETAKLDTEVKREQLATQRVKNLDARQQQRLKSSIIGAAQLNNFLSANDIQGAQGFLQRRKANLEELGIDTVETDDAMRLLQEDPEALKDLTQRSVVLGQQLGYLQTQGSGGSEFERILEGAVKSGTITPDRARELTQQRLGTVARGGVDPTSRLLADISFGREAQREKETGTQEAKTEFEPERAGMIERERQQAQVDVKKEAALPRAQSALNEAISKNDRVLSKVDEVLPKVDSLTAGFAGSKLASIPGTEARDVQATIDTIKANLGFEELQRMRDNSPTGGALGQVSERELQLLTATVENLEQSQSPSQLKSNLNALKAQLEGSRQRIKDAFDRDFGQLTENEEQDTFEGFTIQEVQ